MKSRSPLWGADYSIAAGQSARAAVLSIDFAHPDNHVYLNEDNRVVIEKHDRSAVETFNERLQALGLKEIGAANFLDANSDSRYFIPKKSLGWVDITARHIEELRKEGWHISEEVEVSLLPTELAEEAFDFEVEDEGDWWFSLTLNIDIDGKKMPLLPILLAAIRALPSTNDPGRAIDELNRNGKYLSMLPDGRIISLPFERVKSILSAIQELISPDRVGKDLKLSVLHAVQLLHDEQWARSSWRGADRILSLVERLRNEIRPG